MSNADYAIVMETLSTIIIRLAKYLVAISNAALMILISRAVYTNEELNSYIVIGFLFFIAGLLLAIIVLGVFDTAVEALFICFLTDLKVNGKNNLQFSTLEVAELFGEYRDRIENEKNASKQKNMQVAV